MPANSLYTLTFIAAQVIGLVILAPLGVKALGIVGSLGRRWPCIWQRRCSSSSFRAILSRALPIWMAFLPCAALGAKSG